MKTQKLKRMMSLFLAALICVTTLVGFGTTAYAAEETDEVCLVSFPRDGDANYGGEWGHGSFNFMNGWFAQTSRYTTVRAMGSYDGNICYCIEPGVPQESGDRYTKKGENFWDNYPSSYNHTISPDDIKLFIGRIFQYGYTGTISTSWRSQNEGGDKLAHAVATQLLVWETIVGERDADFNKVGTGGKDAICDQVSTGHPLYSQIMSYYNSIAASVQTHSKVPSFFAKSTGKAKNIELEWDGEKYTATLTDTNNVLSNYTFSASVSGIRFSVNGKKLVITADTAPSDTVRITAEKKNSQRRGVITWTDGVYGPNGKLQDIVTYAQSVNDPVKGYLNIKVSYGSAKIVKTSEDGKVEGISFTITGNGVNKTVQTGEGGVIQIDNLTPGVYTVIEQAYDKYEPQEVRRVTVVSGQVATVNFSNVLKRGDLTVTKTSEDGLNEGVKFHLFGTSLSGLAVDEYAVTDSTGKAHFRDVLIGTGYTLEEVETAIRYVVPENQTAAIEWNKVTSKSFTNILKKWNVTVTKSDSETGTPQGDASLGGAVYGIYKGEQLIFCDTGLEFPQMYEHLNRLEAYIGRPIIRLKAEHDFEYYFYDYTPKRKNPALSKYRGMSWAGPRNRWCTGILKTRVIDAYLRDLKEQYEIMEYVGIAADETQRIKTACYPLVEWGMSEKDCLDYCYARGFDWGGLYRIFSRVSCWCCPLQSLEELRKLYRYFPDLWRQLEEWDESTWRTFIKNYSVRQLAARFVFKAKWQAAGGNIRSKAFHAALRKELSRLGSEVTLCRTSKQKMLSKEQ